MIRTGLLLVVAMLPLSAGTVTWIDWQTAAPGSVTGVLHLATDVNVTYTGDTYFVQTTPGVDYWNPQTPYLSATVANAPDQGVSGSTDIIALNGLGPRTLSFSQAVDNLFFAVVSLNGNGYVFNQDFNILSDGCGYWGCGTLGKTDLGGGQFRLDGVSGEPHGVIQFTGSFNSITWTSQAPETWNGFTVGVTGITPTPGVPEPGTWTMMLGGAGLLGFGYRRRR